MGATNARQAIREAFCALVEAEVTGLTALPYEPGDEGLPTLPLLTMLADMFSQDDRETGPVTQNVHGWELRIHAAISDDGTNSSYRVAQEALEDLVPAVLGVVRAHPDISGTCEWARVVDTGQPVEFFTDRGRVYAIKSVQLRCEVFETVT